MDETRRQLFHIIIAILAIAFLFAFGRGLLMGAAFVILLIGLVLINRAYLGQRIGPVDWFIRNFEREGVRFPGWGSACYATGVLLLTSFLNSTGAIAAGIWLFGIGDGISTLVGQHGKIKLPYNKRKTLEGSLAFFLSGLIGYVFIGPLIIPAALLAAFIESLPLPIDDNLSIPVALTIMFLLLGVA
ncbi:Uncharacterised protein [uncultured archaeon]|nr:Uncharacterised protein [uncultured archaeon]